MWQDLSLSSLKKQLPVETNIETVEKSVDEISKLIYDLLTLERLEVTQGILTKESFNLSSLLEEIVDYIKIPARERKIRIVSSVLPDIIFIGDKKRLEEAIINLLSNSMKYMSHNRQREIFIDLSIIKSDIIIRIQDTGIGIAKENINLIFHRFFRIRDGARPETRGTGLGLSICQKIIERHRGTIDVESSLGQGSTFTILLPKN